MKRRMIAFVMAIIVTFTSVPLDAAATEPKSVPSTEPAEVSTLQEISGQTGDVTWRYDEMSSTLFIEGNGSMEDYSYKESAPWSKFSSEITSLEIDEGVTEIGNYSFWCLSSLEETLIIPSTIERIGEFAFSNCFLEKVIIEECENGTVIEQYAFQGNSEMKSISLGNCIEIQDYCFSGCMSLENELVIPDSVNKIGVGAFEDCYELTSVVFGRGFTEIIDVSGVDGSSLFKKSNYQSMKEFKIEEITFRSIHPPVYDGDYEEYMEYLFADLYSIDIFVPSVAVDEYKKTFPEHTSFIQGLDELNYTEEEEVPEYVIDEYGAIVEYNGAGGDIIIPSEVDGKAVTQIGMMAFNDKNTITSVEFPESLTAIGTMAFAGCKGLTEITIPKNVTLLSYNTFQNCTSLKTVTIIGSKEHGLRLEANNFAGCSMLETVDLGYTTIVGSNAFRDCVNLHSITWNHVTELWDNAFLNCTSLKGSIRLPDKMTSFGYPAFIGCGNITELIIGENTTSIGYEEVNPFEGMTGLTSITFEGNIPPEIHCENPFHGLDSLETITVSEMSQKAYESAYADYMNGLEFVIIPWDAQIDNMTACYEEGVILLWDTVSGAEKYIVLRNDEQIAESSESNYKDSKIEYNKNYTYTVYALSATGADSESATIKVNTKKPEKILNVTAVSDYGKIHLSWSKSNEVDSSSYYIYRKSNEDTEYCLLTKLEGRDVLTYTDNDVKNGVLYSYYVLTKSSFGIESDLSDTIEATPKYDTTAPVISGFAPENGTYISGNCRITANAIDDIAVTKVDYSYSLDGGDTWKKIDSYEKLTATINTSQFKDSEIMIKAVAYDEAGNKSESKTVKYIIDNTAPTAVLDLTSIAVYSTQLSLEWKDVTDDDVTHFILESKAGDDEYIVVDSHITTLGYNVKELIPSTTYTFRVAAVDHLGHIGTYSEYTIKTKDDKEAPVISKLSPEASRVNGSIPFYVEAVDNYGIKNISIQISTDLKNWTKLESIDLESVQKEVSHTFQVELEQFPEGCIYVRAVAEDFYSNFSDTTENAPLVEYIIDRTAPDSPRNLIAAGADGYIYLSWIQGDEDDLSTYSVYRSESEDSGFIQLASGLRTISYYDTTAERDTVYYYKIAVCDNLGNVSDFSETVSAKMLDDIIAPEIHSIAPADGSAIGPKYHTVGVAVSDNQCVKNVIFEYKINDGIYSVLSNVEVGHNYKSVYGEIPLDTLTEGDRVSVRIKAEDFCGNVSEYSKECIYTLDLSAPAFNDLNCILTGEELVISWNDGLDTDLAGYMIYELYNGTEKLIATKSSSLMHVYELKHTLKDAPEGDYTYRIVAYDNVGNSYSALTDSVFYKREESLEDKAPVISMNVLENMEIGVEEIFDASGCSSDVSIVNYLWNFGDGTTSTDISAIKKYDEAGSYNVSLTVTDENGLSTTEEKTITVKDRNSLGRVQVQVIDDNGNIVSAAPVYYNLGNDNQKIVYTDENGLASYVLDSSDTGDVLIGCYKSGYLPVTKTVTILPNATRMVTLNVVKEELVTGDFEITRMTFDEIIAAGIDITDPANQNVVKVKVTIKYGNMELPVEYVRNNDKIIDFSWLKLPDSYSQDNKGPGSDGGSTPEPIGLDYIPNEEGYEILAVLTTDMSASILKEFFDVKLHIINNATSEFTLKNNSVNLNLPEGLTIMENLAGNWSSSAHIEIPEIKGQETQTVSWVLRGDKVGSYYLEADYNGILDVFNEPITAKFKADTPLDVFGMNNFMFDIEVNRTIRNNAFYFNIGLKNNGTVDMYCPKLDYNGMVNNITSLARQEYVDDLLERFGLESIDELDEFLETADIEDLLEYEELQHIADVEDETFDVMSALLNVRYKSADGTQSYINYKLNSDNSVDTGITVLAPGETVYYEYVAYNMTNGDTTGYFDEAVYEVLEGICSVMITAIDMNLYSDYMFGDKFAELFTDEAKKEALDYLLTNSNYIYVSNSDAAEGLLADAYNVSKLALTLDFSSLTADEQKDISRDILVSLLTDEAAGEGIEETVNLHYINAAIAILTTMRNSYNMNGSTYLEPTQIEFVTKAINATLKDQKSLQKLADALKNLRGEKLEDTFWEELGFISFMTTLEASTLTFVKTTLSGNLTFEAGSAFYKSISKIGNYGGLLVESGFLNPLKAKNDADAAVYLHGMLKMNACYEEAMTILNAIINVYQEKPEAELIKNVYDDLLEFKADGMIEYFRSIADGYGLEDALCDTALELKAVMEDNYMTEFELFMHNYEKYTLGTISKTAIKTIMAKYLSKVNLWHSLLGGLFEAADTSLGWEDKLKNAETFALVNYASLAISINLTAYLSAYSGDKYDVLNQANIYGNTIQVDEQSLMVNSYYLLKYLCKSRLLGEERFKNYIESNNGKLFQSDEDFDNKVVKKLSKIYGIEAANINEVYDHIYKEILTRRDLIFNIESSSDLPVPDAPKVTIDYDNLCTNEIFDSSYEYCLSDGIWRNCTDDSPIIFVPKTHTSTLRVRKKSGTYSAAGNITTVTIFAKKELSKTITVKYDDGKYIIDNLNAEYTYQVVPVNSVLDSPEFTHVIKNKSNAEIADTECSYLAIRAMELVDKQEMTTDPAYYIVAKKSILSVITEGNGKVTQSGNDGTYFIGEEIILNAEPGENEEFVGWYIGQQLVSHDTTYIMDMYRMAEIKAKFTGGEPITAIEVSKPSDTLYPGAKLRLNVTFTPDNASDKTLIWDSSNPDVVTVDSTGVITCKSEGNAIITASTAISSSTYSVRRSNIVYQIELTVGNKELSELILLSPPDDVSYYEGEKLNQKGISLLAKYANGDEELVDNYKVSGFDSSSVGIKTVTLTYSNKSTCFDVTVVHDCESKITKESTCAEPGLKEYICSYCNETVKSEEINQKEHTKVIDTAKTPTCTESGLTEGSHCSVCSKVIVSQKTVPAKGHSYGSWITDKAATCTTAGSRHKVCKVCKKPITETIKATGHKYKVTKTVKATTKKNGKLTKKCTVCAKVTTEILYRAKTVSLSKTKFVYNGKTQKPKVTVKDSKGKVISTSNYKVSYSKGCKNAGTYKVTVTFKGQYSGKLTKSFKITKAKPKITASSFTKFKGDKSFYIKPKISPKGGKVTYKTSNKKIATVSSKGKVTIKKKGKVTITITSASNKNCSKVSKKITVTVK